MNKNKKLRACFISALMLISVLSILIITPTNSKAILLEENETLYFHGTLMEGPTLDQNISTKSNDTTWPPKITDQESLIEWVSLWAIYGLMENESESLEGYFNDLMEILTGSPLSITGTYYNTHTENVQIKGNVKFDLFFSSNFISRLKYYQDSVKVSLYAYDENGIFPKMIKNTTADINSDLFKGSIQNTEIIIEDVDYELEPTEDLLFSVKINPADRPIGNYVEENLDEEEFRDTLENISGWLKNDSEAENPELRELAEKIIDRVLEKTESGYNVSYIESLINDAIDSYLLAFEGNITDLAPDFVNALRSASFIYDSADHPSSVSLTFMQKGLLDDDNIKIYYLHDNNEMNTDEPTGDSNKEVDLSSKSGNWDSEKLETSKILKEATANLFFDYRDLRSIVNLLRGKIILKAELYSNDTLISSTQKELDRTRIISLINGKEQLEPILFDFSIKDDLEISYDHRLGLKVYVGNETKFGMLNIYRYLKLLYDSKDYNSYLSVRFDDTNHIRIDDINGQKIDGEIEEKIAAHDSIEFVFNISSDYDDTVLIAHYSDDDLSNWVIDYPQDSIAISENGYKSIHVFINSTHTSIDSYGEELDLIFEITGKTGRTSQEISIEISEEAVVHNIDFDVPEGKKVKPGKLVNYKLSFVNNNTGYWPDDYTIEAVSNNNFDVNISIDDDYNIDEINNVLFNSKVKLNITLDIDKNTKAKSDVLTITVTDENGKTYTQYINTTISEEGILETIYGFFESVAKSLGLDSILGDYAALFLILLLLFIIIFFVLIIIFLLRRKYIELTCVDKAKVIPPDGKADYEITIRNPSNRKLNYNLYADSGTTWVWNASIEPDNIVLEPKESKTVILTVKPTDLVKPNDHVETKVIVRTVEKQKTNTITTVTSINDEKPDLKIASDLKHTPDKFNEGDLVTTSFKLENRGKAASDRVTVILYVNGEEKNKVEDITIPGGGYAEIEIPWIAVKGKNEINIVID